MSTLRLVACLVVGMLAEGRGCSRAERRGTEMTELDETSAGETVAVATGEQIRVTLRETAGTGFRWTDGSSCGQVLRVDGELALAPQDATPGGSGARTWRYTAVHEGSCDLTYMLARSWEKGGSGKVLSFRVRVGRGQ